jgi:hypothetical protein
MMGYVLSSHSSEFFPLWDTTDPKNTLSFYTHTHTHKWAEQKIDAHGGLLIKRWTEESDRTMFVAPLTRNQSMSEPRKLQDRNKCRVDSTPPHPETHKWAAGVMMPRDTKLSFVGNLSLKSLQTNMDNFKGTCMCQIRSSAASRVTVC